ncbi:MAG: RNA polymerase sigma factor [Chloroflexi bacterium]|nr:RNA polymerase sigma factor [Chloroflexota bacterium]
MFNSAALTAPLTSDVELLRQVASGDARAFDELYVLYGAVVYNYLLRLVNEPPIAEELLQEVFLAVWRGADRFRAEAKVKTWLLRIAHHQAVTWLRRHRPASSLDEAAEIAADDDHIDERLAWAWEADRVRAALTELSPKHRAVIELAFVHDLPYTEIARIVDCPVGTVKSRMSYALRHLTAVLGSQLKG